MKKPKPEREQARILMERCAMALLDIHAATEDKALHDLLNTTIHLLSRANTKLHSLPKPTKTVTNIMSGKEIEIDADTPLCCDPSSETYWSM